jgi:hypothetical protein
LLLDLHGTAHRSVDAVEDDKKGIAPGVDDPAAILLDRWVDQVVPQSPQPFERPNIVEADQAGIARHVGMDDCDCQRRMKTPQKCRLKIPQVG